MSWNSVWNSIVCHHRGGLFECGKSFGAAGAIIKLAWYRAGVLSEYLRRVDHTNHASIAVSDLSAVEPDWVCIVHGEGEDGGLELRLVILCLAIIVRVLGAYRFITGGWHKPTEKSSIAHGLTWLVKCCLDNRVVSRIEVELDFASWGNGEGVWRIDKAIFTNIDGLDAA